jgi:hypothetical protein
VGSFTSAPGLSGTSRTPSATTVPSAVSAQGNDSGYGTARVTVTVPSSKANLTGSKTFFRSSSPGEGVLSGKTSPSTTKFASCSGSPKSPP